MKMRKIAVVVLAAACAAACQTAGRSGAGSGGAGHVAQAGDTGQQLFNDGWVFFKGDDARAEQAGFDDSGWRKVELPHDWSIEGPFDAQLASATAFLPGGIGWYRKHFAMPANAAGKDVSLTFDGIYKHSTIYVNGQEVGGRAYGYSTFSVDITNALHAGDNVIAVRVDHHDFADSRWYPGSGIYRKVYLNVRTPVHIAEDGVFVTTPTASAAQANIRIQTTIKNETASQATFDLRSRVLDSAGNEVYSIRYGQGESPIDARGERTITQEVNRPGLQLWSLDHPVLYTAVVDVLQNGKVIDTYRAPFGVRSTKFDPNTGFWLNGENLKLKGVCLHEDAGALGSAIPQEVWERRLRILKDAGCNAIRTSHNPPDPAFLDLCDRLGFLVMDEAFDEWSKGKKKWIDGWNGTKFGTDGYHSDFAANSDRDVQDMVRRDRNHPSIVMWSIGNEIDYPNDPYPLNSQEPVDIAKRLLADVKAVDTSRPVTAACAAVASNLYYPLLDIVGYNYQENRYAADHAANPSRVIYGSENKQDLGAWLAVKNNPFISAQFLWTGIDYLGEAHAYPNHASTDGFLDLAGFDKPAFWFRKSIWNDTPMVHIETAAGRPGRGGQNAAPRLNCYTNGDTVEFFQDGKSLGEQPIPQNTRIINSVPGDPTRPIHAVAKVNGKPVAETDYAPAGAAAKLVAAAYKTTLGPGDGPHVAQIEVTIADANGTRVEGAANEVSVQVGPTAKLLAIESGDNNSSEDPHTGHRKAFHGRVIVYVETHGKTPVTITAEGLSPTTLTVGN